ncbi:MAG: amidophosphoribosyltransferase, partial [Firmicutes bacterium]|nr:amidophosphoribosyltransferase [Candidatus Stercoripulliclostridium pullicola]
VYDSRYECGRMLAELYKIDADIVSGVPDSAVVAARGYAEASGLPYVDALSKNRYIGRTFIQPEQSMRESSVKIKLNAFRSNIKGKRLILIDDSIVRGTTSKKIISLLRASGATEVHMIVASPVVKFPCYFGVDMETKEQLIGGYRNEDEICKIIGADSLHYIPLELLKKACGGKDYCTGCFNADYAENVESVVKSNKTANE